MKTAHNKKIKKIDEEDEEPSRDSRGFEALADLISSDVVKQVKMGMAVINPIEELDENPEESTD